jgi:hypothetical protein
MSGRGKGGKGLGKGGMKRHRRVYRNNFVVDYRTASLLAADANISLCHSSILTELERIAKRHCESLLCDMVAPHPFMAATFGYSIHIQPPDQAWPYVPNR